MDFLTKKEYENLQEDIRLKTIAIDIFKTSFEKELKNGLGEKIKEDISKPKKSNWWLALKIKFQRWKLMRKIK